MELQVGVKVALKNAEGKYLLLQRSAEKYPEVGAQWDIVGGRIDPGKPLLENLAREVQEETGLVLQSKPKLLAAQDIFSGERHIVRLTYLAEITGEPRVGDEHTAHEWFSLHELQKLDGLDQYFQELVRAGILD